MSAAEDVSIVIVTWKGDALLRACLGSLARVYGSAPEIVVIDNANEATTRAVVSAYVNAAYVATTRNLGFAGGNNAGLARCTRDLILLLNNDTVFRADSLAPLVDFLAAHPKAGIVQGTLNVPSLGDGLDDCGMVMTPLGIQRHLHRGKPTATTALAPRRPSIISAARHRRGLTAMRFGRSIFATSFFPSRATGAGGGGS